MCICISYEKLFKRAENESADCKMFKHLKCWPWNQICPPKWWLFILYASESRGLWHWFVMWQQHSDIWWPPVFDCPIFFFFIFILSSHVCTTTWRRWSDISKHCVRVPASITQTFSVNMGSLKRLKCSLCLSNTALCIKLALKPWCFTV